MFGLYVHLCATCISDSLQGPEEDLGCPKTTVTDSCDDVGIETGASGRAVSAPNLWAIVQAASTKFFYN